ncbi:hypothetical protein GCM10023223_24870 [Stackebrandtia albiflava]
MAVGVGSYGGFGEPSSTVSSTRIIAGGLVSPEDSTMVGNVTIAKASAVSEMRATAPLRAIIRRRDRGACNIGRALPLTP